MYGLGLYDRYEELTKTAGLLEAVKGRAMAVGGGAARQVRRLGLKLEGVGKLQDEVAGYRRAAGRFERGMKRLEKVMPSRLNIFARAKRRKAQQLLEAYKGGREAAMEAGRQAGREFAQRGGVRRWAGKQMVRHPYRAMAVGGLGLTGLTAGGYYGIKALND